jgi:hypothetical protein
MFPAFRHRVPRATAGRLVLPSGEMTVQGGRPDVGAMLLRQMNPAADQAYKAKHPDEVYLSPGAIRVVEAPMPELFPEYLPEKYPGARAAQERADAEIAARVYRQGHLVVEVPASLAEELEIVPGSTPPGTGRGPTFYSGTADLDPATMPSPGMARVVYGLDPGSHQLALDWRGQRVKEFTASIGERETRRMSFSAADLGVQGAEPATGSGTGTAVAPLVLPAPADDTMFYAGMGLLVGGGVAAALVIRKRRMAAAMAEEGEPGEPSGHREPRSSRSSRPGVPARTSRPSKSSRPSGAPRPTRPAKPSASPGRPSRPSRPGKRR